MLPIVTKPPNHPEPERAQEALMAGGYPVWLARALVARGVGDPALARGEYPLLGYRHLMGIVAMAKDLCSAIGAGDRITVVADYDCDGATACAVAVNGLGGLGAVIDFVVPNRFVHGYGLTPSVVDLVRSRFPDTRWIVTVDNGISSVAGVAAANAVDIRVLVTDHHLPGPELPKAAGIVNPNQVGCAFESKHLAGCGVMYYVVGAVRDCLRAQGVDTLGFDLADLLDLVALGTVADVVRLDANNRWLVQQGLMRIRGGLARPGIRALFAVAQRDPRRACAQDFGFALGPRLNAAGRLDDMSIGIRCLLETDEARAESLAGELHRLNTERKLIEGDMRDVAVEAIDLSQQNGRFTRVVFDESFHEGVIGIVAGRIKEQAHVPTVVFAVAQEEGLIKGSGRSIPGLHLRDALDLVHKRGGELFHKFGGHAMAAGVTLERTKLKIFNDLFETAVAELLEHRLPTKVLEIDGDLPDEALGDLESIRAISNLVWGQGFEEPVWMGRFVLEDARLVGSDKNHLALRVRRGDRRWKAMRFFCTELPNLSPGDTLDMAYRPSLNVFRGDTTVDLVVVDL